MKKLFIIGPMGAGKTTMGRQLGKKLHLDFIDSDHEIELRTGVDIPLIFEKEGEEGFREREQTVIDELTQKNNIVLATGGGAILREANRRYLKSRGTVLYLHTDIKNLIARTRNDDKRPLLQTANPEQRLRELMEIREPLYRETADVIINTGEKSIHAVIKLILKRLDAFTNQRHPV